MLQRKDCLNPLKAENHEKKAIAKLEQLLQSAQSLRSFPKLVSSEGEEIELPESIYNALYQVVEAMASGTSITIAPIDKFITIRDTASLLNVSTQYVHKLLKQGDLQYTLVGTIKQLKCQDVLEYKQVRDAQRQESLNKLTAFMQEDGLYNI